MIVVFRPAIKTVSTPSVKWLETLRNDNSQRCSCGAHSFFAAGLIYTGGKQTEPIGRLSIFLQLTGELFAYTCNHVEDMFEGFQV